MLSVRYVLFCRVFITACLCFMYGPFCHGAHNLDPVWFCRQHFVLEHLFQIYIVLSIYENRVRINVLFIKLVILISHILFVYTIAILLLLLQKYV